MTEIIVYRNPMEAAFWNMISGGEFFPIVVGAVVGVLAVVVVTKINDRVFGAFRQPKWASNLSLAVGAAVWAGVTYMMWL